MGQDSRSVTSKSIEMAVSTVRSMEFALRDFRALLQRTFAIQHFFKSRPDDIFVVTYPKSGTTLMQMMLYQMTSDGSMDFSHIYEISPWLESEIFRGNGKKLELARSPRFFKSHLTSGKLPRTGRLIYIVRDVRDVAVSSYHHYAMMAQSPEKLEDFVNRFLLEEVGREFGSWFDHIASWWPHRHDPNVLFLRYEDIIADIPGTVRKVSRFCEISVSEMDLPRIVERCGVQFMKQHSQKFDPRLHQGRSLLTGQFIRKGEAGDGRAAFSPEQQRRVAERLNQLARRLDCPESDPFAPVLLPRLAREGAAGS